MEKRPCNWFLKIICLSDSTSEQAYTLFHVVPLDKTIRIFEIQKGLFYLNCNIFIFYTLKYDRDNFM